jgi:hypothetical protein
MPSSNHSAAHLLRPGLALPSGDAEAESFAESMYPRVLLNESDILGMAGLPTIENDTVSLLQEILCKLSNSSLNLSDRSASLLLISPSISPGSLLLIFLPHAQ